ncbi:histone-like nucleoid-structuring protein Lsr2 [Nocardia seriolae]|uniref:Nucleoid-associated protein n=1 Tax=Nocardia seriolae TaxID=37332 RepID=A0A0B8N7L6_9NOCA|nr:Lsr2 family protein [Nocardia seriolae]APB01142.1 Nucleoid-associated protein Lsr2 [Nocardia seriolae]MTJ61354.1 Lsr2 family protein [Nocardia seriolae]MTJ71766.1 Lsr2 family protein [Nocardia seriolae]MTJ90522.1 Lsr2 family protein [Nocardia seriolae]MTK34482.1 Lsr2 family protein [Nocardia seriolae]
MAKKVTVTLVDDYDGESKADETVFFSIDGNDYEIDLSNKNAGKLRESLETWTEKARKVGRSKRKVAAGGRTRPAVDREESTAIREWARAQGHQVSSRGRIPAEIVDAYQRAKN